MATSGRSCAALCSPSTIRGKSPCRVWWRSCAPSAWPSPRGRSCACSFMASSAFSMRLATCCAPGWRRPPGSRCWITVDDTGARHKAANGTCTQIGNDHFAWFGTTASKSRLNFLELLRAGHPDYVINAEALAYMRERGLSASLIEQLAGQPDRHFPDRAAWYAHLERLGITDLRVSPDPVRIATEGALWGAIKAHGLLPDTVVVSDDAGQFLVGCHALCRVGGDVAIPAPHRPGRADFPHPVLQDRASLPAT